MPRVITVSPENMGGGKFVNIPVGTKLRMSVFEIDEVAVKSGANAGKPQLSVTAKVTEEGPYNGREIRYNNVPLYDAKNAWVLTAFAEAVGWTNDDGDIEVPDNVKEIRGTEFLGTVGERADNSGKVDDEGKPVRYNTVTRYAKLGKGSTPKETVDPWASL